MALNDINNVFIGTGLVYTGAVGVTKPTSEQSLVGLTGWTQLGWTAEGIESNHVITEFDVRTDNYLAPIHRVATGEEFMLIGSLIEVIADDNLVRATGMGNYTKTVAAGAGQTGYGRTGLGGGTKQYYAVAVEGLDQRGYWTRVLLHKATIGLTAAQAFKRGAEMILPFEVKALAVPASIDNSNGIGEIGYVERKVTAAS